MKAFLAWAKDAAERAVRTAAQTALGMLGANAADVLHAHALAVVEASAAAALLSLLTSVVASRVGSPASASLVPQQPTAPFSGGNNPPAGPPLP